MLLRQKGCAQCAAKGHGLNCRKTKFTACFKLIFDYFCSTLLFPTKDRIWVFLSLPPCVNCALFCFVLTTLQPVLLGSFCPSWQRNHFCGVKSLFAAPWKLWFSNICTGLGKRRWGEIMAHWKTMATFPPASWWPEFHPGCAWGTRNLHPFSNCLPWHWMRNPQKGLSASTSAQSQKKGKRGLAAALGPDCSPV